MNHIKQTHIHVAQPVARITRLLRQIQSLLPGERGKFPTYAEIAEMSQVPEGTVKDWFNGSGNPSAEFLLRLLENIPENMRYAMLDKHCRVWPRLDHPRLSGDLAVQSTLRSLLSQSSSLSFIQGNSPEQRTFVLSALGNSAIGWMQRPSRLTGIDVHEPDWFVPVPGITYLHNTISPVKLKEAVTALWSQIRSQRGSDLILLNGIWAALPELHQEIYSLSSRTNLIISDAIAPPAAQMKNSTSAPITLLTVATEPPQASRMQVKIQAV